jgi:hypothetical protein
MIFALAVGGRPLHHGEHCGGSPDTRDGQTPRGGGTVRRGIVRTPRAWLPRVNRSGPCAATGLPVTCRDHPETRKQDQEERNFSHSAAGILPHYAAEGYC